LETAPAKLIPSPLATFFGEPGSPMDYRLVRYQAEFIDQIARL
jgi:hypothetical protein